MDWTGCDVVESNPLKLGGKPIVKPGLACGDGAILSGFASIEFDPLKKRTRRIFAFE